MDRTATTRKERLARLVARFHQCKVVVVGDLIADRLLYGEINRVSREAPVLILSHQRTETIPGGAANCAINLAALGAHTVLVGSVGDDEAGRELISKLKSAGVDCGGVFTSQTLMTTTKVRVLAGRAHSAKQQVIRVDYENQSELETEGREALRAHLFEEAQTASGVIISDYNYGVADALMTEKLREVMRAQNIPVLVDSRFRLAEYAGLTSGTPNQEEVEQLLGGRLPDVESLEAAGKALLASLGYRNLLITRGPDGMMLLEEEREPEHINAIGPPEPVDGTGAGDTVIATYALALACGASASDAAYLASHAGGIVVMKRGTASVTCEEVLSSLSQWVEE
jgi:D-glycero-beta-D-manno-heptose-7-phosphate kinase